MKYTYSAIWIQVVLWALLVILPMSVLWIVGEEIDGRYLLVLGLQTLTWMALFYLNYLLLIPQLLFRRHTGAFIWANIGAGLTLPLLTQAVYALIRGLSLEDFGMEDIVSLGTVWLMFLFLIFAALSIRSMQRNSRLEAERDRREAELATMELERLKSQLNPHFLFNSLNNISALSAIDTEATQEAIGTLSSMLRYVLYDTSASTVALSAEIGFISDYISLMRLRYNEKLHIDCDWPANTEDLKVAPLLFISLIENAFKYGASSTADCRISMSLKAGADGLRFEIDNSLCNQRTAEAKPGHNGVGLRNLRRRLELLYPQAHTMEYGPVAGGGYRAALTIRHQQQEEK